MVGQLRFSCFTYNFLLDNLVFVTAAIITVVVIASATVRMSRDCGEFGLCLY